jgi:ferredoxin
VYGIDRPTALKRTSVPRQQRYQVTLVNSGLTLDVGADEPIYQAALKAGIQLPIGCNYGGCITCAAKLISGQVRQPGASAINKRQSKAGYVLLCVARPKSDCVIADGVESHDELYENPFAGGTFSIAEN